LGRIKEIAIYMKLQYPEGWKNMGIDVKEWLNREGEAFLYMLNQKSLKLILRVSLLMLFCFMMFCIIWKP